MRVVIAEDDTLYREGLARLLTDTDFEVVAQARDAPELERKVAGHRPDIVVTDVRMPPTRTDDGLRAALRIRARFPETAVLVLSQYVAQRPAAELIGSSARGVGYLLKDRVSDADQFVEAVRRVAEGGTALDPEIVASLLGRRRDGPLKRLTPRELDVLKLMAAGYSNQGIAERLTVSDHSLTKHIGNVLRKLDIPATADGHRRVLAVLTYLRADLIPRPTATGAQLSIITLDKVYSVPGWRPAGPLRLGRWGELVLLAKTGGQQRVDESCLAALASLDVAALEQRT